MIDGWMDGYGWMEWDGVSLVPHTLRRDRTSEVEHWSHIAYILYSTSTQHGRPIIVEI